MKSANDSAFNSRDEYKRQDQGYEVEIAAHAVAEASKLGGDADFILLGPPVRFEVDRVKALFPDKPVEAIDTVMYLSLIHI